MLLTVVIPARNEGRNLDRLLPDLAARLDAEKIASEIVVVDDGSEDDTAATVLRWRDTLPAVRLVYNRRAHGFGMAIRAGLEAASGDAIAIMMADSSDDPSDLIVYFRLIEQGYDCAFGSRFIAGGKVEDYPGHKLALNRMANNFIRLLFRFRFNDVTNAFKCYSREAIEGMYPLISPHFNLTVEMPLKAIIRGYSYAVVPITWRNRKEGVSKLKIKEMGSRYLFIVLYLWLEKTLVRGDYRREERGIARAPEAAPRTDV